MFHLTQPWPLRTGRAGWLAAAATCLALLVVLAVADASISRAGQALPEPVVTAFAWITRLGESDYILIPSLVLLLASGLLAAIFRNGSVKPALWRLAGIAGFVFVGVGLPSLFTTIVKRVIGRGRPEYLDTLGPFDFRAMSWLDWTYQSFPSGHSTTAFAFCFVVGFLVPRAFPWMLAFAVLVALSRIVVGAHYPTDVFGGVLVGILGAYLVRNFFAARGWVFERRPNGAIEVKSFAPLRALAFRR